jgi:hypothetical protein
MSMTLSDEQVMALRAKFADEGLSLEEWLRARAAEPEPAKNGPSQHEQKPRRHIAEIIAESMKDVPPEIMATMPKDGASQHDHYIYGWPKREI